MAETVGLTATSTLPNDLNELLKLLILEHRTTNFYLREMSGVSDDPSVVRQLLAKQTEVVVS